MLHVSNFKILAMDILQLPVEDIKNVDKDKLIQCPLEIKEKSFAENIFPALEQLRSEIKELKNEVSMLREERGESVKNDGNADKIETLERENDKLNQYTRRNNVEISGIPPLFDHRLEEKVIEVCESFGVTVKSSDVEACHRLPDNNNRNNPKRVIVHFTNRKFVEKLLLSRKNEIDFSSLGFPEGATIFINENLCPKYRSLWGKCRKLKASREIKYVWTKNGTVKIRKDDSSSVHKIEHEKDLYELFPQFDFS